jgi:acyl-CoA synthetase (AMP-forming)/AMP-acid ligase II
MEKDNLLQFFLAAAEQDRARVHFWNGPTQVENFTYGQLAEDALRVAGFLRKEGIQEGQTVAIVLPTHPDFYRAFFGILLAGAVPSALYPPVRLGRMEEWKDRTGRMLKSLHCQAVLTNQTLHSLLGYPVKESRPPRGCFTIRSILSSGTPADRVPAAASHETAFVQFSSGATGPSKPVRLSHENVLHNARFIIDMVPGDPREHHCISWLPVYHDMGLIGTLISAMIAPANITLIPPELFLARPKTWLEAITQMKGTASVAPNFAYGLCCKRIPETDLEDLDLSSWQMALCGAEPIQPETLRRFAHHFERAGFDPKALTPAYGLAEATLAVTISPPHEPLLETRFDRDKLEQEDRAVSAEEGIDLVSVGRPTAGTRLEIRNKEGTELKSGHVGRIWVKGLSVMQGYLGDPQLTEKTLVDGWLDTGDRGFIHQGNLYICGRYKDLIIIRGKNYDPAPIEESLDGILGVRTGCTVAFGETDADLGTERLVVLVEFPESKSPASPENLISVIREKILRDHQLSVSEVVLLKPGALPRTSSGKKQRHQAKQLWRQNALVPPESGAGWIYFRERVKGYLQHKLSQP